MTAATSIALTEDQIAYANDMIAEGRYTSVEAVVQAAFERMREGAEEDLGTAIAANHREDLRALLIQRAEGPMISMEESERRMEAMFAEKRRALGISD